MGSCLIADFFCSPAVKKDFLEVLERTSGRSRAVLNLYLERHCKGKPMDRAARIYIDRGLGQEEGAVDVLWYIAVSDGKMAVVLDETTARAIGGRFLGMLLRHARRHFDEGAYRRGVFEFIDSLTAELAKFLPLSGSPGGEDADCPEAPGNGRRKSRLMMGDLSEW